MIDAQGAFDVLVIGSGPSGTTAATLLQKAGHRCAIIESTTFPRYHIGESLIPHTYGTLERLGLLDKLRTSPFPIKYSVRFVSPSGKETAPFYFFETIAGERAKTWQVERRQFDLMCQENALVSGVNIHSQTRVQEVLFDGDKAIGLRVDTKDGNTKDLFAKVIIDASGRSTVLGMQLGLKQDIPGLNKAAVWRYYRGGHRGDGVDFGETTVFMIPDRGWFWYIPLPNQMTSVGIVADPHYLFRASPRFDEVFPVEVESCSPLKQWLAEAEPLGMVRGIRKLAYINREIVGPGWLMIGDAAGFLDPVYSSGLYLALITGELAADSVHAALVAGDYSAQKLGGFVPQLWDGIEVIHRLVRAFYDPNFSFRDFSQKFPEQRAALIDCLIGDVVGKDMTSFLNALATMTPPPTPVRKRS